MQEHSRDHSVEHYSFASLDIQTNLENTFGTRSFFEVTLASTRDLPSDGINWTLYPTH
jgi:hypothetical protein